VTSILHRKGEKKACKGCMSVKVEQLKDPLQPLLHFSMVAGLAQSHVTVAKVLVRCHSCGVVSLESNGSRGDSVRTLGYRATMHIWTQAVGALRAGQRWLITWTYIGGLL
jgi:hypothetical protein